MVQQSRAISLLRDGSNWYAYVGGDPVNFVDPLGLAPAVGGGITQNTYTGQFSYMDGSSITGDTELVIDRPRGHTRGHYQSSLQIRTGKGSDILLYSVDVQSWADLAEDDDPLRFTLPSGTYEGRLYGETASYLKPVGLVNDALGVFPEHMMLVHPNEFTNTNSGRYGQKWTQFGLSEGCQITSGYGSSYDQLVNVLERAGFEFGNGYMNYTDTVTVSINDPENVGTTREGEEVDVHNIPKGTKHR